MKKIALLSILLSAFLLTGCSKENTVERWDLVTIIYTGTFEDWSFFETKEATITAGSGQVILGIDTTIIDMKKWKSKKVTITPDLGYGNQYRTNNIQKVSKFIFDKLSIIPTSGNTVKLGNIEGIVKGTQKDEQGNDIVLFDINPAQTRQNLDYEITIKELKKATKTSTGYTL